jgi:hypothetical protein
MRHLSCGKEWSKNVKNAAFVIFKKRCKKTTIFESGRIFAKSGHADLR